jgi:glycosyltransferase involved in cell wall biosynthesis
VEFGEGINIMKVAIVSQPLDLLIPPYENSIGIWTNRVAGLLAKGHRVTVFAKRMRIQKNLPGTPNLDYQFVASLPNKVVRRLGKFLPAGRIPDYAAKWYYLDYILPIALQIRREEYDVVHIHNFSQFVPIIRSLNPNVKIVLHMACEWLTQLDYEVIRGRLEQADLVIGTSQYIVNKIRARFPEHAGRCHTVFNGVDAEEFQPAQDEASQSSDEKRLLFVGRVSPEKGVHDLVKAFVSLAEKHPSLQLDLVGPGGAMPMEFLVGVSEEPEVAALKELYHLDYLEYLRSLIPSGLERRVHFWGGVDHHDIPAYYHHSKVLVNPSYSEAFGMSLIEAMACARPLVVTRVGGMVEIVEDSQAGLLVKRSNPVELADAIDRILQDETFSQHLGENGRQAVLTHFTWPQVTHRLADLYKGVLDQSVNDYN